MLAGNANFNAAADLETQAPVYYLAVDGIATPHYSTAPVKAAAVTKSPILGLPVGEAGYSNLLTGSWTTGRFRVELADLDGAVTALVAAGRSGSAVATWKNRKATLYAGYADLAESDYVAIFTGRCTGLRSTGLGYELEFSDPTYLLDGELSVAATAAKPATLRGNVVNVVASFLRGVFSTTDADFPLAAVSTDTGSSSAPTGLGIPDAALDIAGIKAARDTWRPDDLVELEFRDPVSAREYLAAEFFRAFQARPVCKGDGKLGLAFNVPALPAASAPAVDLGLAVELRAWEQDLGEHLNKFRVYGDHDPDDDSFALLYGADHADDTADRTATGETVEYRIESKWLRSAYDGAAIAAELAGRLRQIWLLCPARAVVRLNFRARRLEPGDVVAVTHPDLPDLRTGLRGIASRLMIVLRVQPDFGAGALDLELLDAGLRRYGVISPSSVTGDYSTASAQARDTFFFICNASSQMADGSDGYRLI